MSTYQNQRRAHPSCERARARRRRLAHATWYLAVVVAVYWMPLWVWVRT